MKKYFAIIISVLALVACSNISEDDRLILVENREVKGEMAVLVEDYTGQKCTNCPSATRLLNDVRATFGEAKVIPVAIHSGGFGYWGNAANIGLMTELGEYYWNKNGFTASTPQPSAIFNRRTTSSDTDKWSGIIYNELSLATKIVMEGSAAYDADSRTVTISITHQSNEDIAANLQLWLTESNIVAMQIDNGVTNREYVHNHVLRAAINGNDGEPLTVTNDKTTTVRTYTIPTDYVAENCDIVAFFYNATGVLNVIDVPVK